MKNHNEISSFIWNICDTTLRGLYKPKEYGDIILPFLVLRRMDCVLEPLKDSIIKIHNEYKDKIDDTSKIINTKLNLEFSNYSQFDMKKLTEEPSRISENLYEYLNSFSDNVQDIIKNFEIDKKVEKLEENDYLFKFIEKFSQVDLHPSNISNHQMGTIFEEFLRKFSELSNETSGEHYTPRDVVELIVSLVFSGEENILNKPNKIVSIYDPCCGTGGMLTIGKDWLIKNSSVSEENINLFGQELNPQTFSICKSDFLITNQNPKNIKYGSTLSKDGFSENNKKFDYMICNPPYGENWDKDKEFVLNESKTPNGRFSVGTPRINDGQLLFLQHMISKMESNGSKIGVIFNGSSLFTGKSNSGESEIRKWIIENDWLESIVSLPDQLFFNTDISTYVWIVSNKKSSKRRGKIQLIDGSHLYDKMSESLGDKRKKISLQHRNEIISTYLNFEESRISKIFDNKFFGYNEVTIEVPLVDDNGEIIYNSNGKPKPDSSKRENNKERLSFDKDINSFFDSEIKPFLENSWIDRSKDRVGYEINFNKFFYDYKPLRKTEEILKDLEILENDIETEMDDISRKLEPYSSYKENEIKYYSTFGYDETKFYEKIPSDWKSFRLGSIGEFSSSGIDKKSKENEEKVSMVNYTDLVKKRRYFPVQSGDKNYMEVTTPKKKLDIHKLKKGDMVFLPSSETSEDLGYSSLIDFENEKTVYSYHILRYKNFKPINHYFKKYLTNHHSVLSQFSSNGKGTTRQIIDRNVFNNIHVLLPPDNEQVDIVNYLDTQTEKIDKMISREKERTKLLKEFRQSLISEVMSGKKKVNK